jgi:hypothetical protein
MEATIKEVQATQETTFGNGAGYAIWTVIEAGGKTARMKVLARKATAWKVGDKVIVDNRGAEEKKGPDGATGWRYGGFKRPGSNFGPSGGNGGGGSVALTPITPDVAEALFAQCFAEAAKAGGTETFQCAQAQAIFALATKDRVLQLEGAGSAPQDDFNRQTTPTDDFNQAPPAADELDGLFG